MRRFALLVLLASLAPPVFADPPPILSRTLLFTESADDNASLSPDGHWLAWARRDTAGVANVWIRGLDRDTSWQVTHDPRRGVHYGFWTPDGSRLLFTADGDGDQNDHVFSVEIANGHVRDLTPFVGARAEGLHFSPEVEGAFVVGLNIRDRHVFDAYRVDLHTGAVTLEAQNPGDVIEWTTDRMLRVRGATALRAGDVATVLRVRDLRNMNAGVARNDPPGARRRLAVLDPANAPWRDLVIWPFAKAGFDRDEKIIEFLSDTTLLVQVWAGGNTSSLVTMSTRDARVLETLANDPRGDLWSPPSANTNFPAVVLTPDGRRVAAVGFDYLKPEWKVLDASVKPDFDALAREANGDAFRVAGADHGGRRWLVLVSGATNPGRYLLWDRKAKTMTKLFDCRPELAQATLASVEPVTIPASDGRAIPCYLALPPGVPPHHLPLMAWIHGGPWFRDTWDWDPVIQLFANRGYAVLQVEFRGSTGFGLDHLLAADHEFGAGKVLGDVTDAIRKLEAEGTVDPRRVGIMGYSFGGYSTLAGLAFAPEVFACGVDEVGPSDLAVLFHTFPAYWGPRRQRWINWMGDVENDDALNRKLSPLYHVDAMHAPLMIGHGANDPRVKLHNSELIVNALRARGVNVAFVVYPDEGHGFDRAENNLDFYGRVEEFLAKNLGGRAEPWVAVRGATAQVR